jgi:hypothetical protein
MLRACGRIIGCAVAYTLLINLVLAGILGAQYATGAQGEAGFALCLNGSDGVPAAPGDTPGHAAKIHCALCTVGGQFADTSAPALAIPVPQVSEVAALLPVAGAATFVSRRHSSASPRGPPQTA